MFCPFSQEVNNVLGCVYTKLQQSGVNTTVSSEFNFMLSDIDTLYFKKCHMLSPKIMTKGNEFDISWERSLSPRKCQYEKKALGKAFPSLPLEVSEVPRMPTSVDIGGVGKGDFRGSDPPPPPLGLLTRTGIFQLSLGFPIFIILEESPMSVHTPKMPNHDFLEKRNYGGVGRKR